MKKHIFSATKDYLKEEFSATRTALNLTQEEMAYRLQISTRAYVNLEGGHSCCSLITLTIFLLELCPDRHAFLDGLLEALERVREPIA